MIIIIHIATCKISEINIGSVTASVLTYDNENKKWLSAGISDGPSKVQLYHNKVNNKLRMVAWKMVDREVVLNFGIPENFQYFKASSLFHQWRDSGNVFGLSFTSPTEAEEFSLAVHNALGIIKQSTRITVLQRQLNPEQTTSNSLSYNYETKRNNAINKNSTLPKLSLDIAAARQNTEHFSPNVLASNMKTPALPKRSPITDGNRIEASGPTLPPRLGTDGEQRSLSLPSQINLEQRAPITSEQNSDTIINSLPSENKFGVTGPPKPTISENTSGSPVGTVPPPPPPPPMLNKGNSITNSSQKSGGSVSALQNVKLKQNLNPKSEDIDQSPSPTGGMLKGKMSMMDEMAARLKKRSANQTPEESKRKEMSQSTNTLPKLSCNNLNSPKFRPTPTGSPTEKCPVKTTQNIPTDSLKLLREDIVNEIKNELKQLKVDIISEISTQFSKI